MEIFKVHQKIHFNCGLKYYNPKWSLEKNQTVYSGHFSEQGFGHNFCLEVIVRGPLNVETGMVITGFDLKILLEKIVKPLDHKFLNTDVDFFQENVPTTENIARYCFLKAKEFLVSEDLKIEGVRLLQGDSFCAEVFEDSGSAEK